MENANQERKEDVSKIEVESECEEIKCNKCGKLYTTKKILKDHIKQKHGNLLPQFLCPKDKCSKTCTTPYNLLIHIQNIHKDQDMTLDEVKNCTDHRRKTRAVETALAKRHSKPVFRAELSCKICGKICHGSSNLNKHYRLHEAKEAAMVATATSASSTGKMSKAVKRVAAKRDSQPRVKLMHTATAALDTVKRVAAKRNSQPRVKLMHTATAALDTVKRVAAKRNSQPKATFTHTAIATSSTDPHTLNPKQLVMTQRIHIAPQTWSQSASNEEILSSMLFVDAPPNPTVQQKTHDIFFLEEENQRTCEEVNDNIAATSNQKFDDISDDDFENEQPCDMDELILFSSNTATSDVLCVALSA